MIKYKCFIANYNRYIVFVPDGKENAVTRRLYSDGDSKYHFVYNNEKVKIGEDQLYW